TGRSRVVRRRVLPTAPRGGVSSPPPPQTECRHATARPAWTTRPFGHPRDTASSPAERGRPERRSRAERPASLRQLRVERTRLGERGPHFGFGGGDHRGPSSPCIEPTLGAPGVAVGEGALPADGSPPVGACLLNVEVGGLFVDPAMSAAFHWSSSSSSNGRSITAFLAASQVLWQKSTS